MQAERARGTLAARSATGHTAPLRLPPRSTILSFFDEGDEPTRARPARPRRPRPPAVERPTRRSRRRRGADPQQLRVRHAVALGVAVLVLILLVVGIKGCRDSRQRARAEGLQPQRRGDHPRTPTTQVTKPLLRSCSTRGERQSAATCSRRSTSCAIAAEERRQARQGFDVPGDMKARAARPDADARTARATALGKIAEQIPTAAQAAASAGRADAIDQIAGQMQAFLASDVVYSQRVAPLIKQALDDNGIGGQTIATSSFLPNLGWLEPGDRRAARLGGRGGGAQRRTGRRRRACTATA